MISIVIPTFNRTDLLFETVNSITNQTFQEFEIIIVDDISTDNSFSIILNKYNSNNKIRIFQRDQTDIKGVSTCRNLGAKKANFSYIMFLDSDELLLEKCLEERASLIRQNKDVDAFIFDIGFFYNQIGDMKSNNKTNIHLSIDNSKEKDYLYAILNGGQWHQVNGLLWKKNSFLATKGFDNNIFSSQDYDHCLIMLKLQLSIKKTPSFQNNPLVHCRVNSGTSEGKSLNRINQKTLKLAGEYTYMYNKHKTHILKIGNKHILDFFALRVCTYFFDANAPSEMKMFIENHEFFSKKFKFKALFLWILTILGFSKARFSWRIKLFVLRKKPKLD